MPTEYKVYTQMLKTIESIQKSIKSSAFPSLSDNGKRNLYASVFGARYAANAERNKKSTLKGTVSAQEFEQKRNALIQCPTFQTFINRTVENDPDGMKRLLTQGHGGAAEDAFKSFVMEYDKLPSDVPERYMPTAEKRIEQQQKKLEGIDPKSDQALRIYAEIFRCRRAVGAVRKKGSTLEVPINGQKYADTEDLAANEVFSGFVKQYGGALRTEALAGHGGAAEELFRDHLLKQDHIPAGAPADYMPTAIDRLDTLKARIKSGGTKEEQRLRLTEIMATREAVNAVRGDAKSLSPQIGPEELEAAYQKWSKCETFQSYLQLKPAEAYEAGTAGHGGKLKDVFMDYVLHLDHIPDDVPQDCMPNADKRLEALKEKYQAADYTGKTEEEKLALAAELMATREVVQAVRGKKESLEKPVDPVKLNEAINKWKACAAFQDFVKDNPAQVREGGSSGHGGLMGDRFKEFVLRRDSLEDDIPVDFMPTAAARIDVLKKKIQDNPNPTPEQKQKLYAELLATRSAVSAVRGNAKSLNGPVDPVKLSQEREKISKSSAFQAFLQDSTRSAAVRAAALTGHGGALEDEFKDYVQNLDVMPQDVPDRYMPTAYDRIEALQKKIREPDFPQKENAADLYVELIAAREAVNAQRGKSDTLKVRLEQAKIRETVKTWKNCTAFREFVNDPDSGAREAATAGHGGALADAFKDYVKNMERIPEDVPEQMLPTALERNEALKNKLKTMDPLFTEPDEYTPLYAQMLASRASVGAIRGKKETLEKRIDPKNVNRRAKELTECSAFGAFLARNQETARRLAGEGHGGKLEEGFKYYVQTMTRLPTDVPQAYMPTAAARIEGLQDQVKGDDFKNAALDTKVTLFAELLGARRSVNAVRGNADSLNLTVPAEKAKAHADKLMKCTAFREFIEKNPDAAKKAAASGHGGALEDAFKDYVKNMDRIPSDVPQAYMPTALERTEILQKKIKSSAFQSKNMYEQNLIYKELVATRAAVEAIRGSKKSLDVPIDAEKLGEARNQLYAQGGADSFFDEASRTILKDAAVAGHGGALEDKLKADLLLQAAVDGVVPEAPARYQPTSAQLRERIKQELASELKVPNNSAFDTEKEITMKKVAGMMYLTKLERKAQTDGTPVPTLTHKEMQKNVDTLMNSKAFRNMFEGPNAVRDVAAQVRDGRMTTVFEKLNRNKAILDQERQNQAPQRRNQLQQNEEQAEQQNQRLRRNNSMNIPGPALNNLH